MDLDNGEFFTNQLKAVMGTPPSEVSTTSGNSKLDALQGILSQVIGNQSKKKPPLPMTEDEVLAIFLASRWNPVPGDKVKLRPEFDCKYGFPTLEQECYVTQVLTPPIRRGDDPESYDMVLGFYSEHGSGETAHKHFTEYYYDSRHFTKVGTISDRIAKLPPLDWAVD